MRVTKGGNEHRYKNRHKQIEERRENVKINKAIVTIDKSKGYCVLCNTSGRDTILEYHHLDPRTKIDNVSDMVHHNRVITVKKEMQKCVLLCYDCHRKLHSGGN